MIANPRLYPQAVNKRSEFTASFKQAVKGFTIINGRGRNHKEAEKYKQQSFAKTDIGRTYFRQQKLQRGSFNTEISLNVGKKQAY